MKIQRVTVAALFLAVSACGGESKPANADSAAAITQSLPASAASASTVSSESTPACLHDGAWAACTLERRLKQSGFVVKRLSEPRLRRSGFSVAPIVYSLGKSRLEVFLYRDSVALAHDLAQIDTLTAGPRGTPSQWGEVPPALLKSVNLLAVVLTTNQRQAERLMLAITAGPPQPGSPR